jgi:hypothetical protein
MWLLIFLTNLENLLTLREKIIAVSPSLSTCGRLFWYLWVVRLVRQEVWVFLVCPGEIKYIWNQFRAGETPDGNPKRIGSTNTEWK